MDNQPLEEKGTAKQQTDNIAQYLEGLQFKRKAFGGYDKEDVFGKLAELSELYEARLNGMEQQVTLAEEAKEAALKELDELKNDSAASHGQMQDLQTQIKQFEQEKSEFEEKRRLVADMEMRQKMERNEVLMRAEHEAKLIISRAEQKATTMGAEARQKMVNEIKEKRQLLDQLNHEINERMCDIRSVLRITDEEFTRMQSTITGLEERLNAYPPVMFIADGEGHDETYYVEGK